MAADSAKSTSTSVSQAIKSRFYVETFLKRAESKLVHKQLGQLNQQIPQGQGGYGSGVVYWTRFLNLPTVSAGQGEGVPTTAVQMTAVNVTGTVAQYDAAVSISDILVYTSFGDMMKQAMEQLGYNAGLSIDTLVRNAISESLSAQIATGAAHITAIPQTGTLSITEIRKAKRKLSRNDAMEADGRYWIAVVHPDALYDLMGDTTTGGWIDANKYNNESALFEGEVGKLYGVRFLETSNGFVSATASVTGTGSVYVTNILGREAFGVTNLQNLKTIIHPFGSGGVSDPTDKVATAGWKCAFGTGILNTSFGVNIKHVVSATA